MTYTELTNRSESSTSTRDAIVNLKLSEIQWFFQELKPLEFDFFYSFFFFVKGHFDDTAYTRASTAPK